MKKSEQIKLKLLRQEHLKEAMKVHDTFVLRWLKCLKEHEGKESQAVADEFTKLEAEWKAFCEKKNFIKDAQIIFHDTIQIIVAELKKQGTLKVVE